MQAEADRPGVTATVKVPAAPFVVTGVCDGRAFYLRERHGSWRVTIASDGDPLADPWGSLRDETTIDIASGEEDEFNDDEGRFFSHAVALRVAVTVSAMRCYATRASTRLPMVLSIVTAVAAASPLPMRPRGGGHRPTTDVPDGPLNERSTGSVPRVGGFRTAVLTRWVKTEGVGSECDLGRTRQLRLTQDPPQPLRGSTAAARQALMRGCDLGAGTARTMEPARSLFANKFAEVGITGHHHP